MNRRDAFARYLESSALFSRDLIGIPLHRYQAEIADYVMAVVAQSRTEDITVEMSRQSGKNETSAQIEAMLLARYARSGGVVVKTAPTWSPQIVRSKHRLEARTRAIARRLPFLKFGGREGYIIHCGEASVNFLSGRPTANVVGDTASLLLEIDEAQDLDLTKYDKDFAPMRASTGAPGVFYGTTWTDATLLERTKIAIREGQVAGRVFLVPWDRVAADNPRYGEFVQRETQRLGADHPIIRTQYKLEPIEERGRLLKGQQLRQMIGDQPCSQQRTGEPQIVAGLDFAGADEEVDELSSLSEQSGRDSVALTIGRVDWITLAEGIIVPLVKMLARFEWVNVHPTTLHSALYHILENQWKVNRVHCDATGVGEVPTAYLAKAMNKHGRERVVAIKSDSAWNTQTRLAFQYIAAVNGGRLLDYQPVGFDPLQVAAQAHPPQDDVDLHAWWQRGHARLEAKPGKKVRAYVPSPEGHDDILSSELLLLDAAHQVGLPQQMKSAMVDWYGRPQTADRGPQPARSDEEIERILSEYSGD